MQMTRVSEVMEGKFDYVRPESTVAEISGIMSRTGQFSVPVIGDGGYLGLVTASDMISSNRPRSTKAISIVSAVQPIDKDSKIGDACEIMWRQNLRSLPVSADGSIAGLLTFFSVAEWALKDESISNAKVDDVPLNGFSAVDKEADLDIARVKLRDEEVSNIILDEDPPELVVDEHEYAKRISRIPKSRAKRGERGGEKFKFLSSFPLNISERISIRATSSDTIGDVLRSMVDNRATHATVEGMVMTYRDLLRFLCMGDRGLRALDNQTIKLVSKTKLPEGSLLQFRKDLESFASQWDEIHGIESLKELKISVKDTKSKGSKRLFLMSANLISDSSRLHVNKRGWDEMSAFKSVMAALRAFMRDE